MGVREIAGWNIVGGGIAGWMSRYFGRERRRDNGASLPVRSPDSAVGPFGIWPGEDDVDDQYANYFFKSVPVYAAVKLRADAVARPELRVYRVSSVNGQARREWVGREHPAQSLLDGVNPYWTGGDLWRATETYLNLWGESYWAVERDESGTPFELWPLRPDRVRVVPDEDEYIRGYVYTGLSGESVGFAADEVVRMRYFNPLDEYAGLSPIGPARLSVDMGMDALRGNRSGIGNDATPGVVFETDAVFSETEVEEFYRKWESRHRGPSKKLRPGIIGEGMKASQVGFSPKDMEYLNTLRWTVEDVARAFNVPKPLLHDLERATYANIETTRRMFWETCIVPELRFFEEALRERLLPMFGETGLVAEFDTSNIEALRESETERARRISMYVSAGVMTVEEARAEVGLGA